MYNIWCELRKENVVLVIIGFIMTIISFFIDYSSETLELLVVTMLFTFVMLKQIIRYSKLKNNGILLNNVPYHLDVIYGKTIIMIVDIEYQNQQYKLMKKNNNFNNIPNSGVTKVIIDPKNIKRYYIFLPQ